MAWEIVEEQGFKYVEKGEGDVMILLHGLFGALSNFGELINHFCHTHRVVIPLLPLYDMPLKDTTVPGFVDYVERFVAFKQYSSVVVIGNSLGGHIGLIFTLQNLDRIRALVLTGSSGLFENALGDTFPKRGDYKFVKEKTEYTFYDPRNATKELVDEVYEIVNDREKALKIISTAKSALRHNLSEQVQKITVPTLLIWGKNDTITPAFVGEEFHKLIPDSKLVFLEQCGHAPMMERPAEFNEALEKFLNDLNSTR